MKWIAGAALLAGGSLAAFLVFRAGLGALTATIASVGWQGLAALCAGSLALLALMGCAWFAVVPGMELRRAPAFVWGRIVRDGAAEILPFSQFGGLLIGIRAVILRGIPAPVVFASTIVDVTTDLLAQIVFIMIAIALWAAHFGTVVGPIPALAAAAAAFGIAGSAAFILMQRRGLGMAERLARRWLPRAIEQTELFSLTMRRIYDSPARLAFSSALHLVAWLASAALTLLAVRLAGARIGFGSAVAIDGMVCVLRSAAIFVPAALGVQEAGYAMLMPLFGVPAEIGLAVSLLKRAREIAPGLPALALWQVMEGRRALRPGARLPGL